VPSHSSKRIQRAEKPAFAKASARQPSLIAELRTTAGGR